MVDRWKRTGIRSSGVKMIEKPPITRAIIMEKDKGWEELRVAVHSAAGLRGLVVPTFVVKPIDITPRAKARRAQRLEQPLSDGRRQFASSHRTEAVMWQFLQFRCVTNSIQFGSSD